MFIGHYSAAFAVKAAKPDIPLWHLFVAVQLVDFAWAGLIIAGIEKARIEPGFLEASMLDLYHMPITHALPSAILWAVGGGLIYALMTRKLSIKGAGLMFGLAVFSHWALDLLVHTKDLELYWGGPKVGLGLWSSLVASQGLEIGLFILTAWLYFRATKPIPGRRHWVAFLILALLIAVQLFSLVPPPELPSMTMFAVQALFAYSFFAFLAWLIDRSRTPA